MRKFEEVKENFLKFPGVETKMPERADIHSAGYDFFSKEDVTILPGESHMFWTDVKATMFYDNVLNMYTRSGNGVKRGIILMNNVGVVDAGYYNNETNDGNIGVCLKNTGDAPFEVKIGDRIAQGIFCHYLITDDDKFLGTTNSAKRSGGFGSTGR